MEPVWTVEMKGMVKRFGSVAANDGVDFSAAGGEIHALLGENGAGKSTMMSMLSGIYRADEGVLRIHGEVVHIRSPKDSALLGIGMVHQNFRLVPTLTAAENMLLGDKTAVWRGSRYMKRKQEELSALASRFGLSVPVDRPVWQLSVGEQQRVEIVKTLYRGADIIILDEPTSVLTPAEAEQLLHTLAHMKQNGKTVIVTTHKLKEVMASADRISVMRKGRMICSMLAKETNEGELASLMVGRELERSGRTVRQTPAENVGAEPILKVEGLEAFGDHGNKALNGVSLAVRPGEIVGIAGVAGNGQKELAETLTGLRAFTAGRFIYEGNEQHRPSARRLIELGVSHVPENRMKSGLAGSLNAVDNLLLKSFRGQARSRLGFLRRGGNRKWAERLVEQFDVKTPGLDTAVRQLSGGNQQKLLFAREIDQKPRLMVAVHPTQGLDVGATESLQRMLRELRDQGGGILLISEDLDEILQMADRILVIYNGKITGEFTADQADREQIGLQMAGSTAHGGEAV